MAPDGGTAKVIRCINLRRFPAAVCPGAAARSSSYYCLGLLAQKPSESMRESLIVCVCVCVCVCLCACMSEIVNTSVRE